MQGEWLHQDLKTIEDRYRGRCDKHMWQATVGASSEITQEKFINERATFICFLFLF